MESVLGEGATQEDRTALANWKFKVRCTVYTVVYCKTIDISDFTTNDILKVYSVSMNGHVLLCFSTHKS